MFYQPLVTALQAPLNEQRTKYHPAGVCRMPVIDKLRRVPLLCDAPRNQFRQFYLIFGHRGVAEYSLSKDAVFALSSTVKATAKSVQALLTDVSKAKEIIARFSIEPEIEIFLKKVSAQQATVFDLATEVLSWLKNQGLTGKLKVYFYQKIICEFRLSL